ncbi:hypothetical protein FCM35_KLT20222 [Carex littledalei]|uniref:Uncharacterized protein n=1 Tax=Carex littledalei TaxID=544730 RepID=A0A833VPD4_9POAL|nr:hypothetical protein FCM35_KLT20222 [Carex littledalei]
MMVSTLKMTSMHGTLKRELDKLLRDEDDVLDTTTLSTAAIPEFRMIQCGCEKGAP